MTKFGEQEQLQPSFDRQAPPPELLIVSSVVICHAASQGPVTGSTGVLRLSLAHQDQVSQRGCDRQRHEKAKWHEVPLKLQMVTVLTQSPCSDFYRPSRRFVTPMQSTDRLQNSALPSMHEKMTEAACNARASLSNFSRANQERKLTS